MTATKAKAAPRDGSAAAPPAGQDLARESSMLRGGPRDGRCYWTDRLDDADGGEHHRSNADGYRRTGDFVSNRHAPGGVSRIWEWRG